MKYDRRPRICGHAFFRLAFIPVAFIAMEGLTGFVFEEQPRDFAPQTRERSHGFNRA